MSPLGQRYARELLARQGEVLSPRRFGLDLADHHAHIMSLAAARNVKPEDVYFVLPERMKSYGLIAMAHRIVTDTPIENYINAHELSTRVGALGPNAMVVVLDDVAGSGSSQRGAVRDIEATSFPGHIVASPLLTTQRARNVFEAPGGLMSTRPRLAFEPRGPTQALRESAFYLGLSPHQQLELEQVIQDMGFDDNGLSMAFPYMSPDNNNAFFAYRIAHYFVFNQNTGAVKKSYPPWAVPKTI